MSLKIDMSDPSAWTEVERRYLQDRGQLPADVANVVGAKVHPNTGEIPNHGDANTWGKQDSDDDVFYDDVDDDYDGMTVSDLKVELKKRNLVTPGTKPELVARLREDDRTDEDDDAKDDAPFEEDE